MSAVVCTLLHILSRPITWLPEKEIKKYKYISETKNGARDDGEVNDGKKDGWTNRQKERKTDGRTDVELFHPMAIQPSLNAIAAKSKASPEKQNSAVRWIAIFSYFPKRTGEEPPVVVL
jgi:hypothetical protein